jgi:hypothetical protein
MGKTTIFETTMKCQECKFTEIREHELKYIHCKKVCERCFIKLREGKRLIKEQRIKLTIRYVANDGNIKVDNKN